MTPERLAELKARADCDDVDELVAEVERLRVQITDLELRLERAGRPALGAALSAIGCGRISEDGLRALERVAESSLREALIADGYLEDDEAGDY